MISMFDLKNSKIWHKFSCIIVTSYWKVQCAHSNHDSICALHIQCVILHISYDKMMMMACSFVMLVISQHLVFWRWMWKVGFCLTKTTHHILMSPLTHLDEAAFFIHALGKQINYDCLFVEGQFKFIVVSFFLTSTQWPH
jgi:hypothetical protein